MARKVCCYDYWTPCPQRKLVTFGGSLHVQSYPNAGSLHRNRLPRVPLQLVASGEKNPLWLYSLRKCGGCSHRWNDAVLASLQKRLMWGTFYSQSVVQQGWFPARCALDLFDLFFFVVSIVGAFFNILKAELIWRMNQKQLLWKYHRQPFAQSPNGRFQFVMRCFNLIETSHV